MNALRDNRDQIAEEFDSKVSAIRKHFDSALARLSDEVMSEAQAAQSRVESLLGETAAEAIKLDSTERVVVEQGEAITNDHISRIQTVVNEYLSELQTEIEGVTLAEIGKISGDIDTANTDIDATRRRAAAGAG